MTTPTSLSQVTVQIDALSVLNDVENGVVEGEDFWVSCYETSRPSVHGKVRVAISDEARDRCTFEGRDGVKCQRNQKHAFYITCPSLHINSRRICFPTRNITVPAPSTTKTSSKLDYGIASLDVSPDGHTWVAGLGNGSIILGKTNVRGEETTITPHKASVACVKLSSNNLDSKNNSKSTLILSASDDFTLAFSDFSASPPTTTFRLTSHTRAITSCHILPNSQALSAGKDGTLRIWDTSLSGGGKQLGMLRSSGDVPIMSLCATHSGSIAALALSSGHFDLVSLVSRNTLFSSSAPKSEFEYTKRGALDAIALYTLSESEGRHLLATGSHKGVLSFYICVVREEVANVTFIGSVVRNGAGISDIKFMPDLNPTDSYPAVLVATTDGLPYQLRLLQSPGSNTLEFEVTAEYAGGADCSPIRSIVGHVGNDSRSVWIAGDDGVIWVYED